METKKYRCGYTTGVFDMFHVGHLNILKKAKEHCDFLIVGVTVDELVAYKKAKAIIPFSERIEIVQAIRYVDLAVPQNDMNKMKAWEKYHFDVMFVGDDWKGTDRWKKIEEEMSSVGVDVIYFPYTKGISSSMLRKKINDLNS